MSERAALPLGDKRRLTLMDAAGAIPFAARRADEA